MKSINPFGLPVIIVLLLSACGRISTEIPVLEATPSIPPAAPTATEYPVPVNVASQMLGLQLGVGPDGIVLQSIEKVDWPDACLGVQQVGVLCAQVVTPGYRILLETNSVIYEYHTDLDGQNIRLASAPHTDTTGTLLTWKSNDIPCKTATFSFVDLSFGECTGAWITVPAQTSRHELRLAELTSLYASFEAETPAGYVTFNGFGKLIPAEAEKRAIAEWAKLMFQVAQAGRAGASWGLAFAWHREGGIAGFCDDVAVYLAGWVTASDCKGFSAEMYLTESQLEQLYGWVDSLSNVDYNDSNAPIADGMTITLVLAGNGQKQADEETIREIIEFAATLDGQLGFAASASPEASDAEKVLYDYLMALHTGDYILAAKLYGGEVSLLQDWNPDIKNDLPALFELACIQNGLQCLAPRSITYRGSEIDGHHFWVEFSNDDGTLFQRVPCCGEIDGAAMSMFPFFVEKGLSGSGYAVHDFPPYVP